MKSIVKLTLAFALGILVTITVILPRFTAEPEPAEITPTPDIQAEIAGSGQGASKVIE